MQVAYKNINYKHLKDIEYVSSQVFKVPYVYHKKTIKGYLLVHGLKLGYVALVENKVIGYILMTVVDNQRIIASIGVLPDLQGQGIGNQLLKLAVNDNQFENIYLHVRVSNKPAIKLYEKNGFKILNTIEAYCLDVEPNEDAYYMMLEKKSLPQIKHLRF